MIQTFSTICLLITCLPLYVGGETQHFILPEGCTNKGENISSSDYWKCIWYNWNNLTCWFDMQSIFNLKTEPGINDKYLIYYRINGFFNRTKYPAEGRCVKIYIPTENYGKCSFNLTIKFFEDRESFNETIEFNSKQIAKPPSVRGVQYNTTTSSVAFKIPLSRRYFERQIRIRYRSEFERKNEFDWKFSDFSCNFTLSNMTAFTNYDILIDMVLSDNGSRSGYWSDVLNLTIRTDDDVPIEVPKFSPGFFMPMNSTFVQIFWNPIPQVKRCGIITAYRLTLTRGLNKEATQADQTFIITPEKISYTLFIHPGKINRIQLSQRTRHGYPKVPDSYIHVFPENRRPKVPSSFSFEKMNRSHLLLTWGKMDTEDNAVSITIVWCRGTLPGYCFKPLKSRAFNLASENVNTASIALNSKDYLSYIYGISLEAMSKEGLITSSGIQWYMDCLYHKYGVPKISPILSIGFYSYSKVFVKWKPYTCEETVVKIDFYILKYCREMHGNCTVFNKLMTQTCWFNVQGNATLIKIQPDEYSYIITGLDGGNNYIVQVGTKLKYGNGPWSKQIVVKLPKKTPTGQLRLVLGTVAGGVGAFLILLVLTIYYCRRCVKTTNDAAANIEVPKLQNKITQENQGERGYPNTTNSSINDSGLGGSGESGGNFICHNQPNHVDSLGNELYNHHSYVPQSRNQVDSNDDKNKSNYELNSGGYQDVSLQNSDEDEYDDMSDEFTYGGDWLSDQYSNCDLKQNEIDDYSHNSEATRLLYRKGSPSSHDQIDLSLTDCTIDSKYQRNDLESEIDSYSKECYGSI